MASRPFIAARLEDRVNSIVNRLLVRRGWQESIIGYTGYGTSEQLRILARVVLRPSEQIGLVQAAQALLYRRGWRNFLNVARSSEPVALVIGEVRIPIIADRGGFIDVRVKNPGLAPGSSSSTPLSKQ